MAKKITALKDIQKDEFNLNVGTDRGKEMIYESLDKYKSGRSILIDSNGKLIAGDKTVEQAKALGMEIHVVQTDGTALLVHQRTDLDMDSDTDLRARELAVVDNRTSEVSYYLDAEMLEKLKTEKDINLGVAFTEK